MGKKRTKAKARAKRAAVPKTGPVWRRSAEQATLDQMPKFNGHACKTGAHGDAKYNRAKSKRAWQKETIRQLNQEGTRPRGSLPFCQQAVRYQNRLQMDSSLITRPNI